MTVTGRTQGSSGKAVADVASCHQPEVSSLLGVPLSMHLPTLACRTHHCAHRTWRLLHLRRARRRGNSSSLQPDTPKSNVRSGRGSQENAQAQCPHQPWARRRLHCEQQQGTGSVGAGKPPQAVSAGPTASRLFTLARGYLLTVVLRSK